MPEQRRLAVILVRHAGETTLTIEQARTLMVSGPTSLVRYWRENAENWFLLSPIDFFGSYDVTLPAPPDSRYTALEAAQSAAKNAGVDLSAYDGFIVLLHPGNLSGIGYDAGSTGVGPGASCVLPTTGNHTFYCHETGHILGFDHTYGIMNSGADWTDDGVSQLYPVYGDPYDIMSSASFGGANPTFQLAHTEAIVNFPNLLSAGPMLSRANLHFSKPAALQFNNKIRHVYEGADQAFVGVYPAGQGDSGKTELVIYHPMNEDESARGRVYVEYRQPFSFNWGSRWDEGLSGGGTERDNRGLVVHVVKDIPGTSTTAVWYAGRVTFPSADSDITVDTSRGSVTVAVNRELVQQGTPPHLNVRVSRKSEPEISIIEDVSEVVTVLASEKRPIPGWEWAGQFTWERRETIRTVVYKPIVAGRGGSGTMEGASPVRVYWYVGGFMLGPQNSGVTSVPSQNGGAYVSLNFSIDQAQTRILTLSNLAGTGQYVISVQAMASDEATWRDPIKADTTFWADGITEGWGEDYKRFMEMWDRITHPIPKPDFTPPTPDDYRGAIDRIRRVFDELKELNPEVASSVQPLVLDHLRALRRMTSAVSTPRLLGPSIGRGRVA